MSEELLAKKIEEYRTDAPIVTILNTIQQDRFKLDTASLELELKSYFVFNDHAKKQSKSIRGPADLTVALEVFEEVQFKKDRVAEILLVHQSIATDLSRLWDLAKSHILIKPEVSSAKSDNIRYSILAKTIPELDNIKSKIDSMVTSAELLTKNLNKTYEIMHSQVETIKQIMIWKNISLPSSNSVRREMG